MWSACCSAPVWARLWRRALVGAALVGGALVGGALVGGAPGAAAQPAGERPEAGGVDEGGVDEGGVDEGDVDAGGVDAGGFDEGGFDEGGFDAGGFDAGGSDAGGMGAAAPAAPSPLQVDGFVRSHWASWVERAGGGYGAGDLWAKGRQSLDLRARYRRGDLRVLAEGHVEYDLLYDALGRESFDTGQVEAYRWRYIGGQQLAAYRVGGLEVSSGRQIVAWGEVDGLSALDHINPRDQREPGVADVDDIRLAVWLTRLRYAAGPLDVDVIVRHEGHYGLLVPPLADYSPLRAALPPPLASLIRPGQAARFTHDREGVSADTQSVFARALYRGAGLDVGLYAALLVDQQGVLDVDPAAVGGALLAGRDLALPYAHRRFGLVGASAATSVGAVLLKGEVAGYLQRATNLGGADALANPAVGLTTRNIDQLSWALSATYSGLRDTTLALEYAQGSTLGERYEFFVPPTMPILSARASRKLLRERLTLSALALAFDPALDLSAPPLPARRGGLVRVDALYALTDQLKLSAGLVEYFTGDLFGPFAGLDDHARLFGQLRWDFTVY